MSYTPLPVPQDPENLPSYLYGEIQKLRLEINPPTVDGFVVGRHAYFLRNITTTYFVASLHTTVTEATFESFGPTGSGADNVWTGMDDMPANSVAVLLGVNASFQSSGIPDSLAVHACSDTTPGVVIRTKIAEWPIQEVDTAYDYNVQAWVPLDASNRFFFTWDGATANLSISRLDLTLKGFIW